MAQEKKLIESKGFLESKTMIFAIITILITVFALFGYNVQKTDVFTIIETIVPAGSVLVIMWKRFKEKIQTFDISAWILAIIGAICAIYVAFTGDTENADVILKYATGILTAIFSILSAFGLHVAQKKITIF